MMKNKYQFKGKWKNKPASRELASQITKRQTIVEFTFIVENTGYDSWPKGTKLIRDLKMNYKGDEKLENVPDEIALINDGEIKSAEIVKINLKIESPNKTGMFSAFWRVTMGNGEAITPRLRFRINVE